THVLLQGRQTLVRRLPHRPDHSRAAFHERSHLLAHEPMLQFEERRRAAEPHELLRRAQIALHHRLDQPGEALLQFAQRTVRSERTCCSRVGKLWSAVCRIARTIAALPSMNAPICSRTNRCCSSKNAAGLLSRTNSSVARRLLCTTASTSPVKLCCSSPSARSDRNARAAPGSANSGPPSAASPGP